MLQIDYECRPTRTILAIPLLTGDLSNNYFHTGESPHTNASSERLMFQKVHRLSIDHWLIFLNSYLRIQNMHSLLNNSSDHLQSLQWNKSVWRSERGTDIGENLSEKQFLIVSRKNKQNTLHLTKKQNTAWRILPWPGLDKEIGNINYQFWLCEDYIIQTFWNGNKRRLDVISELS